MLFKFTSTTSNRKSVNQSFVTLGMDNVVDGTILSKPLLATSQGERQL